MSVLEAFDLPETIADGEDVAIKVAVGTREYQTAPCKAVGGKTTPWNFDIEFPVLNLRDNLSVIMLDENGEAISKSEIDTPSIVEQGSFDVNLLLNGGGNVHLSLSFVLTEEERRRIDVMRAAALKRREQEALKLSASTQLGPVEGESEIRSSELHLTPAGSLEKDSEKAGVPKDSSATASQEADVSQATHEESLICIEPTGKLDKVDSKNQEEPETNLHGSVGGASEYYTNSSDYGGKNDNSNQAAADQMARRNSDISNSSTIKEINSEDQKSVDLDKSDMLQTAAEENEELADDIPDANLKPTSSSVKAKIKAFEKTRPQGATKQNQMLSPSSKIQKFSPHSKTPPRKKVDGEAEQVAKTNEPLHDLETRRIKNEPLEPAKQMEGPEPNKSVAMENVASLETSEAGYTAKEEKCSFETPARRPEDDGFEHVGGKDHIESNGRNSEGERTSTAAQKWSPFDEPTQSVDTIGIQYGNREYQETEADQPKYDETKTSSMQKSKNINLVGLSKQVLSGAVSGAVLIAAGALLWAANPKRRNSSLHQRSKQRKRK